MKPTAQENEVRFNCWVSPTPRQIETAVSQKNDEAVASRLISQNYLKENSHHVDHGSNEQQKQKCTSPKNKFTYEIGTFLVLKTDKEISDLNEPSLGLERFSDVPMRQ